MIYFRRESEGGQPVDRNPMRENLDKVRIVKMSAFASVIGMQELTRRANEIVVTEYRPLEIYSLLILEYLVLVLIISAGVRWLERKMGSNENQ